MTALGDALSPAARAALAAAVPDGHPPRQGKTSWADRPVPVTAYNHRCGIDGCTTWVPNHLPDCRQHDEQPRPGGGQS